MKGIALIVLSLALEVGFLSQVAVARPRSQQIAQLAGTERAPQDEEQLGGGDGVGQRVVSAIVRQPQAAPRLGQVENGVVLLCVGVDEARLAGGAYEEVYGVDHARARPVQR